MTRPPTRDRILTSARRLFDTGGTDAISLRRIATKVGITPMAIYRHFDDREALIDALVLEALDRWHARVAALDTEDPLDWLITAGDEFLAFALGEPRRFEAAFLIPSKLARRYPEDFIAGRSPAVRLWIQRLEELQGDGRLASDAEPLESGFMLWALLQGLITLYRAGRFTGDADDFRAFYTKSFRRCLSSFVDVNAPARTR